jgi:hypothetical protein
MCRQSAEFKKLMLL